MPDNTTNDRQHGIAAAFYSNGPDGFRPTLECSCGKSFREFNWEDLGAEFDAHLKAETDYGF